MFALFQLCIPGEAMADRIVAGDDAHSKLQELQELLQRAQEVEQSLQQQVIHSSKGQGEVYGYGG